MEHPRVEWAGAILVNTSGDVLLNLRDHEKQWYPNLWDLVGGTLEAGETAEDCMRREIQEETGQQVEVVEFLRYFDMDLGGDEGVGRLHVFLAALHVTASQIMVGEGQDHRFFDRSALQDVDIVPGTRMLLEAYFDDSLLALPAVSAY